MDGEIADILVTIKQADAKQVSLTFGRTAVTYDFATRMLDKMPVSLIDGRLKLRVLVDRPMFEAVVNDGQCYFTAGRQPQALGTISVKTEGGSATVEPLEVFKRKSIWKKQHGNRDTMQDSRAYRRKESPHLKRPMNMIVAMVLTGAGLTAHAADEPLTDGNKAGAPAAVAVYGEKHRPQFHFFPKINWTNDPNGMANRKIAVFS